MIEIIFKFLLLSLIVEAVTEIIVIRDIFKPIREYLKKRKSFLFSLISCGACTSVWVSIGLCYLVNFKVGLITYLSLGFLEPLILSFGIHRLATFWHHIYGAVKYGPKINVNTVNLNQNLDVDDIHNENENEEI